MICFQRPLIRQVCGPYTFLVTAVAALLTALMLPHAAQATDRSLHLHAASHGGGRVAVTSSAEARRKSSGGTQHKSGSKAAKSAGHPSKAAPPQKAHSKASHHRHREPEVVDDPITVHRAEAKPLSRKAAARQRLLAREHGSSLQGKHHGQTELAQATKENARSSRWTKAGRHASENEAVSSARSIVLAGGAEADRKAAAIPSQTSPRNPVNTLVATQSTAAGLQGESHPDDDGEVTTLTSTPARQPIRSVVVRSPADNEGEISAAPAIRVQGIPSPRVVTGFGAELAAASGNAHSRVTPETARQQEQMELADDAETDRVTPASPRALADDAMQPRVLPLYTRSGKLVIPAPLKGSREILVHQNTMADHDGLERIRDDRELNRLRQQHMLVTFPESASLRVNYGLPENRRYARPWTARFAADAAHAFYAQFGEPLQVNSAVRTVSYQRRLQRVNGNAAATNGEGASPHLTGQAIDLAKRGMTSDEIGWMRSFLMPFIDAGKIDVEEEFQQACFHISVYRAYLPAVKKQATPKMQVAQLRAEPKAAHTLPAMPPTNETNDQ